MSQTELNPKLVFSTEEIYALVEHLSKRNVMEIMHEEFDVIVEHWESMEIKDIIEIGLTQFKDRFVKPTEAE